jgi:hypothetical protein
VLKLLWHLLHLLIVLLVITFGLVFVVPSWDHLTAVLACGVVFVLTLAVGIRLVMTLSKAPAGVSPGGSGGGRTIRLWALIAGAVLGLVFFALACLTANDTLTAASIGANPLRVVPSTVQTDTGTSNEGPSTFVTYQVAGKSYSFELPAQDSGDTKAQATLAVSRSDPSHAMVYSDWTNGRASSAVGRCIGFGLAFIVVAVLTRALGFPRRRQQRSARHATGPAAGPTPAS